MKLPYDTVFGPDVLPWDSEFVAVSKRPADFQAMLIKFWWKEMLACTLGGQRYKLRWYPGLRSIMLVDEHNDNRHRFTEDTTVVYEYEQWVARTTVW